MRETCFFSSTVASTVSWIFGMFLADFTVVGISSVFHGQPWYFFMYDCKTCITKIKDPYIFLFRNNFKITLSYITF